MKQGNIALLGPSHVDDSDFIRVQAVFFQNFCQHNVDHPTGVLRADNLSLEILNGLIFRLRYQHLVGAVDESKQQPDGYPATKALTAEVITKPPRCKRNSFAGSFFSLLSLLWTKSSAILPSRFCSSFYFAKRLESRPLRSLPIPTEEKDHERQENIDGHDQEKELLVGSAQGLV